MNTVALAIIGIMVLLVIVGFAINKPFRKQVVARFRGTTDEIMAQDATTPEGAAAHYNNAIRDLEERYNTANRLYTEAAGKLETAKKDVYNAQKELMKKNNDINKALDAGNENDAMTLVMSKETLNAKIETLKGAISELEDTEKHQKEVRDQLALELSALKEEKERTIFQLQADQQIIELHESIDSVATNNENDRMLERVREGANRTRERASGSRIAYETSVDTQERRAEQNAREQSAREELERIKRQRGN